MEKQKQVRLLLNDEQHFHGRILANLLSGAKRLECMVAFAKTSGLGIILTELKESLAKGLDARFTIGLSFYQTEPKLLRQLLVLSRGHRLKLYISDTCDTFHPKIYALSDGNDCTVLIGSANLTGGGLQGNYEASAWIDDPSSSFMQSVSRHIDDLIKQNVFVLATKKRIDEYERIYIINQAQQQLAKRRFERINTQGAGVHTETLRDYLLLMKDDDSEHGFKSHQRVRAKTRTEARKKIMDFSSMGKMDADTFITHYEELIALFHSGGLQRGKNIIAKNANRFQAALAAIVRSNDLTPEAAYELLHNHFSHIPRAGVNVLTEILHAINGERFAVMNQNAISGLRLAKIYDFPPKPNKKIVNAKCYAHFCMQADVVREELGLSNFTELDALFNYVYWRYEEVEEDE